MSKIVTDLEILRASNGTVSLQESKQIINDLDIALQNSTMSGLGLAAPQIGINKRVAIVRAYGELINLVNPVIIEKEDGFINTNEGCLSIPGTFVNTQRYKEIFIKDDLHPDGVVAVGDVAVVMQHEIDHLEGILMIDRAIGKGKIGRNEKCPCGKVVNGKPVKYKKCHGKNY